MESINKVNRTVKIFRVTDDRIAAISRGVRVSASVEQSDSVRQSADRLKTELSKSVYFQDMARKCSQLLLFSPCLLSYFN